MDPEPLVTEQIEAGSRFLKEFTKAYPVRVAFWLREQDRRFWHLYIASDAITDENFDVAYGEVIRVGDEMDDPEFDPLRVKVLNAEEPLAKAVLARQARHRGTRMIPLRDTYLDGIVADEALIYPAAALAATP